MMVVCFRQWRLVQKGLIRGNRDYSVDEEIVKITRFVCLQKISQFGSLTSYELMSTIPKLLEEVVYNIRKNNRRRN